MKRSGDYRTCNNNSKRSMHCPVSMVSRAGTAVILEFLLLFLSCVAVQGQTTPVSTVNGGQIQVQSGSGSPPAYPLNEPGGPVISNGSTQLPSSITAAMPGITNAITQKLSRATGMTNKGTTPSLCFRPGLGWIQRLLPPDNAAHAFQTVPLPLLARAAKARRLVEAADSKDCEISSPLVDASSGSLLAGSSFGSTAFGQSLGNVMNGPVAANTPSGTLASTANSNSLNAQAKPTPLLSLQGPGELSYSYSEGLGSTPLLIKPTVSRTGSLKFSIASPEDNSNDTEDAAGETLVGVSIYSFAPGNNSAASQSPSSEETGHVTWSTLANERNSVIGYKSETLKSQEKSATTEAPILSKDLYAYRQLRNLCQKVAEMQETGDVSDQLESKLTRGHSATELARLHEDCGRFLAMNRNTVIKKMQRHTGLK